jgi:SAM-dependent methyltransferase
MWELEDNLWWYRGMRRITSELFDRYLPQHGNLKILDCGAGSGGSLPLLKPLGEVSAFDFSHLALNFYRKRESGRVAQASVDAIPFADATFDLLTVFDVLAILDKDSEQRALEEITRVLKPGGFLFWREPAFMFLYGTHDRATHVKHRYNVPEFRQRLAAQGFTPLRVSYANTFLFPIALVRRLAGKFSNGSAPRSDVRPVPGPLNAALTRVLSAEASLITNRGMPFGLSVVGLAQKR